MVYQGTYILENQNGMLYGEDETLHDYSLDGKKWQYGWLLNHGLINPNIRTKMLKVNSEKWYHFFVRYRWNIYRN